MHIRRTLWCFASHKKKVLSSDLCGVYAYRVFFFSLLKGVNFVFIIEVYTFHLNTLTAARAIDTIQLRCYEQRIFSHIGKLFKTIYIYIQHIYVCYLCVGMCTYENL